MNKDEALFLLAECVESLEYWAEHGDDCLTPRHLLALFYAQACIEQVHSKQVRELVLP